MGMPLFGKAALPEPADSGIEHVVLVMMENRSFDHFLGWLKHANGEQQGLAYTDSSGVSHPTWHLTDFQNCGYNIPGNSYADSRIEYDGGKCDGWLRANSNDLFAIGYYTQGDLAFLGGAAPQWTVCDNYFAPVMAETFPNRIYQHAAQTDRIENSYTLTTLPTIWDRLQAKGLTGNYYFSDIPFLALWGTKYPGISRTFTEFLKDCAAGTLPQVSFVDPRFLGEAEGLSNDDHPHADIRNGEAFLNQVYTGITSSPVWKNTLLIINFDEWGGFFDHVPPPRTTEIPAADQQAGNADGLLGFRLPVLLISPWSPRKKVSSIQFDHTSILNLIEWRWNLAPLTVRDASANNLALALDFQHANDPAGKYNVPAGPFGEFCVSSLTATGPTSQTPEKWNWLQTVAQSAGFPVP